MAGDWIKMRSCLLRHPKVVRIASALKADKLRVIGGLMSAWCLFDEQSEDGVLDGYTPEALDAEIGFEGFTHGLASVGWIEIDGERLVLPRFESHNGQSAKRRAQDADRKREVRKTSAPEADKLRTREEKRREEETTHTPGVPAQISVVLRKYAINSNPSHPSVIALAEQGVDLETLEACCKETREAKPNETIAIGYVLKKLEGWKAQAAQVKVAGVVPAKPRFDNWDRSPAGIERKASDLGIYPRAGETHATLAERCRALIQQQEHAA